MERGQGTLSATQEVAEQFGIPVVAIATLDDLLGYLAGAPELEQNLQRVQAYRQQYGVAAS